MNTLEELHSGKLAGATRVKLALGLEVFPEALFELADTLEILDMTDNNLSTLPEGFEKFKHLKILFLSNNAFTEVPSAVSKCKNLSMLGMRNNHISVLKENLLPRTIRWLILTDNLLETLPDSIGELSVLQKCMLSGNRLTSLPVTLEKCKNLELLRISVNQLTELPAWLATLPKLSWLAYGGNPFCAKHPDCKTPLQEVPWQDLTLKEVLGEGASGRISKATYKEKDVAIKVFKGEMTSDGLPQEEMDINISMGHHDHLVDVLACVTGHPEGRDVLMLELIPSSFFNLGSPPTFESCTRDVYLEGFGLSFAHTLKIVHGMADAAMHMHQRGIMHGDFYAHNILIDKEGNSILGDFGGASYYEPKEIEMRQALERLEVRAFGCLVEELLLLSTYEAQDEKAKKELSLLKKQCFTQENHKRPLFQEIYTRMCKILEDQPK